MSYLWTLLALFVGISRAPLIFSNSFRGDESLFLDCQSDENEEAPSTYNAGIYACYMLPLRFLNCSFEFKSRRLVPFMFRAQQWKDRKRTSWNFHCRMYSGSAGSHDSPTGSIRAWRAISQGRCWRTRHQRNNRIEQLTFEFRKTCDKALSWRRNSHELFLQTKKKTMYT